MPCICFSKRRATVRRVCWLVRGIAAGVARNLERIWKARDISKETKSPCVSQLSPVHTAVQCRDLDLERGE